MNYIKEEKQPLCPLCKTENDKAKHVLQCRRDEERTKNKMKLNTVEESEKVVQICWENKRKRGERREKVLEERSHLGESKRNRKLKGDRFRATKNRHSKAYTKSLSEKSIR